MLKQLWRQLLFAMMAIGGFSFTASAANQPLNNHSPVPQITDQGGFELAPSRWRVGYPKQWTTSETLPDLEYVPLSNALGRTYQQTHPRVRGGNVWYRISLAELPEKYHNGDQIIEFEFPMPVIKVFADKKILRDVTEGNTGLYRRTAKEGRNFLLTSPGTVTHIDVCVRDFPFRFANHVGRVVIRAPSLLDQLLITRRIIDKPTVAQKPGEFRVTGTISNRLTTPLRGQFVIDIQNYFGVTLRTETFSVSLLPGSPPLRWQVQRQGLQEYKLVARFVRADGKQSPAYVSWFRDSMLTKNESDLRRHTLLDCGWEAHWVKEEEGFKFPLPVTGWIRKFPRKVYPYNDIAEGLPLFYGAKRMPTHRLWVRRVLPPLGDLDGKRVVLYLRGINYLGRFYINEKFIAERYNHDLPDSIDITDFVDPQGENRLTIGITDYIVTRAADAPRLKDGEHGGGHVIDAAPFLVRDVNIGLLRPPVLIVQPEVSVKNTRVETTLTPAKMLSITTVISNNSPDRGLFIVQQAIYDGGKKVFDLATQTVSLAPNETKRTSITAPWKEAILWELNAPKLYELRTTIVRAEKVIDRYSTRFGFKEWGIRGRQYTLNGNVVHLYGDGYGMKSASYYWPTHPTYSRISRIAFDGRQELWLPIADEVGQAATWEINMSPFGSMGYRLAGDLIYANLKKKWQRIIQEDRNHPAIFCYTLGNEPPTSNDIICEKMYQHQKEIQKIDPTKMVHFSRGNELMGRSPMYSPHYLFHEHILPTDLNLFSRKNITSTSDKRLLLQKSVYPAYEVTWTRWIKNKPIFDSEGASVTDGKQYVPWLFGEEVFLRRPDGAGRRFSFAVDIAQDVMRAYLYEGYRKNGISSLLAHIGWRWGDESLSPVAAYLYEDEFRLYSNHSSSREIKVLNDTGNDESIMVTARLKRIDGTLLKEFSTQVQLAAGGVATWQVKIPALQFDRVTRISLILDARGEKSGYHYRRVYPMTVFPPFRPNAIAIGSSLRLFDPQGITQKAFAAVGINIPLIKTLDENSLADLRILVIGRGALAQAEKSNRFINARIHAGMRVLILAQPALIYSFPFPLEDGDNVANGAGVMIAAPDHPIFAGLVPEDFRFWQNADRVPLVFQNAPFVPRSGNATTLLAGSKTGYPQAVDFAPLFQYAYGEGLFMVSQLEIVPSLRHDPVVPRFLMNLLTFLAKPVRKTTTNKFAALLGSDTRSQLAEKYGLDTTHLALVPEQTRTLLISEDATIAESDLPNIRQFVDGGGTLYLKGLTSARLTLLSGVFGIQATLNPFASPGAAMTMRAPLFAGLTQYDWAWLQSDRRLRTKERKLFLGYNTVTVSGRPAIPLLTPAYIVRVPFGEGAIILDTSRWGIVSLKKAKRVGLAILRNLGGAFTLIEKKHKDWQKLAAQLTFFPIPTNTAVNRGFADDATPGNGKGGWTDEGKGHDIGNFPVGAQKFNYIPFQIADPSKCAGNGLIALRGNIWANLPAKSKEIAVGKKLGSIFFIHGCAWANLPAGKEMARYIIHYADRKDWIPGKPLPYVYIPVRNKRQIYDWWFYDKIASGEYELPDAFIAWRDKGSHKNRGVAMMEWVNPYPDREIAAIQVEATSPNSQFFFIAATGATYNETGLRRKRLIPDKVKKQDFPQGLQPYTGKLWKIKTQHYLLYLDEAVRIRWLGTLAGVRLFDSVGEWHIQNRVDKNFRYLTHQRGKIIEHARFFLAGDGSVSIKIPRQKQDLLEWSQHVTIRGETVRVVNTLIFNEKFKAVVGTGIPSVSTSISLANDNIASQGKLILDTNGMMVLPSKHGNVTVRFDEHFKRFVNGVRYVVKEGTVSVPPVDFSLRTLRPGKSYAMNLEIDLAANTSGQ